jgi:alanine dehydrogenase
MDKQKKPIVTASFSYLPIEESLIISPKKTEMCIGIPNDTALGEKRIALSPSAVSVLVNNGITVWVEHNAGAEAFYFDNDYSEAGAKICYSKQELYTANVIIKISPIQLNEIEMFQTAQVIFAPVHIGVISSDIIEQLQAKKIIAISIGSLQDDNGYYPILRGMSEIAGVYAINIASQLLSNNNGGKGQLLGNISGVPATQIVIIGAGLVAQTAARTAMGLGAKVKVFDNNVYKLMRLQTQLNQYCSTSVIDPNQLAKTLIDADVLIGAIKPVKGITPLIVTEEMVSNMKAGSIIVDVSIDCGGCVETSALTTLENPTFKKYDVVHYCVPNMASGVARTASDVLSNIMMPFLLECEKMAGIESMLYHKKGVRQAVYLYKGTLTSSSLSKKFNVKHTDIDLIIMSYQ